MELGFSSLQESIASMMEHGGESSLDQATSHSNWQRRECAFLETGLHCAALLAGLQTRNAMVRVGILGPRPN
jgi:hypothetical protein